MLKFRGLKTLKTIEKRIHQIDKMIRLVWLRSSFISRFLIFLSVSLQGYCALYLFEYQNIRESEVAKILLIKIKTLIFLS